MRVRTGKIIKATSLLGQLNIPTIISKSTAASMIVEKKSNAGDFRFGEGINTGQGIFNIISGHIYFFYLRVKNLTPTNTQNRRFSIWDKTADQYVAWIDTTNLNDIEYIANWTATRSSLIYSCFSFQYASNVDNPSCEPELYIAIDLTTIFGSGKEPTAQQFYNKYKDKLELLASGEEIVIDRGSGKANYLVEAATTNLSGITGYEMKCGNNAYGRQFTPSKWGTAAGYVINRATGGYNGMPMSEWHKTAGTDGGFYTWLNRGFTLTEGHTYTASVYVYSNKNATTNGYICSVNSSALSNYYIVGSSFNLKQGWQRLTYTFTVASGKTSTDYCYSPIIYANPDDGEWVIKISGFQIEENDHATAFTTGKDFNVSCNITEKMYGYNQLLDSSATLNYAASNPGNNNFTFTKDSEQVVAVVRKGSSWTGTEFTSVFTYVFNGNLPTFSDTDKLLCIYKIKNSTSTSFSILHNYGGVTIYDKSEDIPANSTVNYCEIINKGPVNYWGISFSGATTLNADDEVLKLYLAECSIINLTTWFGAGKEPTTVAEFKEKFSKDYYGYCPNKIMLTQGMINALPVYEYNQLFYPTTSGNWSGNSASVVFNADGSITATSVQNASYCGILHVSSKSSPWYSGHKYYYACDYYADTIAGNGAGVGLNLYSSGGGYRIQENQAVPEKQWYRDEKIFTVNGSSSGTLYPWIFMSQRSDRTIGDKVTFKNAMFIDLTDWYGVGSEPTTVAEFKATFPHKYYPYMKKSILNRYQINALGK